MSLCLTTILTDLLIFRFFAEVYQIKIKTKYMVAIIFVIATAIHLLVNRTVSHFNLPSFFNTLYGIIHINVWSSILCKEKLKRKLLLNMVCYLIMCVTEILSASIWTVMVT